MPCVKAQPPWHVAKAHLDQAVKGGRQQPGGGIGPSSRAGVQAGHCLLVAGCSVQQAIAPQHIPHAHLLPPCRGYQAPCTPSCLQCLQSASVSRQDMTTLVLLVTAVATWPPAHRSWLSLMQVIKWIGSNWL